MVALFVLAMILTAVLIEYVRTKKIEQPAEAAKPALADRFVVPRGFFLGKGHTWAELLTDGSVRIGADDFVQKLVGSVDGIEIIPTDGEIRKGAPLFRLRKRGRVLTILSPVSGRIVETNSSVLNHPAAVNRDPYVRGWIAVIEPTDISADLKFLAVAGEATDWLRKEVSRFRNFIKEQASKMLGEEQYATVGITLLDGGIPISGVMEKTDEQTWLAFEEQFLRDRSN